MTHSVSNLIQISAKINEHVLKELIEKIDAGLLTNAELGLRHFALDANENVNVSVYEHIKDHYVNFGYEVHVQTPIISHPFYQIWLKY